MTDPNPELVPPTVAQERVQPNRDLPHQAAPTPAPQPAPRQAPQPAPALTAQPAQQPTIEAVPAIVRDGRLTSESVLYEIRRVIVGQDAMLERILVALLAGGHLLLEGVPGLAKTLTIKTLADVLDASFRRIQFTPDLVPADLVGTRIYRPDRDTFDTELGPVFANFLLADEINRAPAKVQSALLEVMQERQVTIGPESFAVPATVPRHGDPEPDRIRGHLPAPRGPGRPIHDEGRGRLPDAPARSRSSSSAPSARPPRSCRS